MSYDLNFWRYRPLVRLNDQWVYEQLCDDQHVDGLQTIPTAEIAAAIRSVFQNWSWFNEDMCSSDDDQGLELTYTSQWFRVDCRGATAETMNIIIEIATSFGCYLYDPQVNKRFSPGDG